MATQKEKDMQSQLDRLTDSINQSFADAKKTDALLFKKLEDAQNQRNRIEIQTTKTNGRVNRLEDACMRFGERVSVLEMDSKNTLEFKGKTAVVTGIVVALLCGGVAIMARALML
jgi:septal ring factor EnvC (AmiA/AmiB activator)